MMPCLPAISCRLLIALAWFAVVIVSAQTPAVPAPPVSRLTQVEDTYLQNLRKLHAPILQDYLRELETLRLLLSSRGRFTEMKQVEAEQAKMKQIASSTGVMPYDSLTTPPPPSDEPSQNEPGSSSKIGKASRALTLNSAEAINAAANAEGGKNGLPLGTVEWQVASLPAGPYDLHMVFPSVTLPRRETITVRFCGQEVTTQLNPDRAAGSPTAFRLLKLGRITLERDALNENLVIQSSETIAPLLTIRSVSLSKAPQESN